MILRIVKMTFMPQHVGNFLNLFETNRERIASFEGCTHLELWRDKDNSDIFFTYSHWKDASYLEAYRRSELFNTVWTENKNYFAARPEAWSVERM
jgi:hypothetical protein